MEDIEIRQARFDDPEVRALVAQAVAEMRRRYGSDDEAAVDATDFVLPTGAFFVAADPAGELLGGGGWRTRDGDGDGDAELKRMFTREDARGQQVATRILAAVEESARQHGRRRILLETGNGQHEAMSLYEKSGYRRTRNYGYYKDDPKALSYSKDL